MDNLDLFADLNPPEATAAKGSVAVGAGMMLLMMQEPLTIHRAYISLTKSVAAGLYLTQCCYLSDTPEVDAQHGWFCRSPEEWTSSTGLSETEQRGARRRLKEMKLLEESREAPNRLWMRLDWNMLAHLLDKNAKTLFGKIIAEYTDEHRAA